MSDYPIQLITFLILCFLLLPSGNLFGQSPYELNLKREIPLLSIGIGGRIVGVQILKDIRPLTESEVAVLRPEDVNRFDRDAIFNNSELAGHVSDVLIYSGYATPLLFLSSKRARSGLLEIGVIGLEVLFLNTATTTLTKGLVKRNRPVLYNQDFENELESISKTRLSFFSGHTSGTAAMSFFSAKVFADYFPDSKWKPIVWSVGALAPAVAAYTRVKSGNHFPTDVITGYTVGALFGILIPELHKRDQKDKDQRLGFSVFPTANGLGLALQW